MVRQGGSERGAGALAVVIIVVVLGVIGFVAWVAASSQPSGGALVPIDSPETVKVDDQPDKPAGGAREGVKSYANASLGFSFEYPAAWGDLKATGKAGVVNVATPKIGAYSVSDALEVYADKTDAFRTPVNEPGIIVNPRLNNSTYEWIITDRGENKRLQVGRAYTPAPGIIHRSGKTTVYDILYSSGSCTHHAWLVPANGHFVRLRLPSFCLSNKTADADVQAAHKADFDRQTQQLLDSITVL